MKKGFTLIELLIVVAIIAILAAIAVPNFLEAQVRAKVSRVKNDQRSLATGIETYYVDNNVYPVDARTGRLAGGMNNVNRYLNPSITDTSGLAQVPSFAARQTGATSFATLTTPIAYITSYFADPFTDTKGATFGYYTDTNGWILFSPGPDTDESSNYDLGKTANNPKVETAYNSSIAQPSVVLVAGGAPDGAFTYDPTNGTVSEGDVYRTKQ